MDLSNLQQNWDEFGRRDPFWAVLTDPQFKGNRWDPAEFFATGEADVRGILEQLETAGLRIAHWRALDFGCAMGRLTQALCRRFHFCAGVDIAPSMIELANYYNNYPSRCYYALNSADNLSFLGNNSFDLVYTRIVLQHIPPPQNGRFIAELTRLLDRGGALVFQVPSKPAPPETQRNGSRGPLPWSAHNAAIEPENPPRTLSAGETVELTVKVRNQSRTTWPRIGATNGCCFVQLGNHWLQENGQMFIPDDGRAMLPHDLRGGEEAELKLPISAPALPGKYWIELDMVEEGVTWFQQHGSKTCRTHVQVVASANSSKWHRNPVMEMHGLSREDVTRIVESAGGKIVAIREDTSAGGWESFLYIATKE